MSDGEVNLKKAQTFSLLNPVFGSAGQEQDAVLVLKNAKIKILHILSRPGITIWLCIKKSSRTCQQDSGADALF